MRVTLEEKIQKADRSKRKSASRTARVNEILGRREVPKSMKSLNGDRQKRDSWPESERWGVSISRITKVINHICSDSTKQPHRPVSSFSYPPLAAALSYSCSFLPSIGRSDLYTDLAVAPLNSPLFRKGGERKRETKREKPH